MNGKTLRVIEYNLTFGGNDRYVNVFGFFKYKKNGNLYIIYTDVDTKYEIVYYGTSHEKNTNLLSMACKEEQEQEIIKEYIYKVINNEPLDNFDVYTIEHITGIELISSNKLEVKLDIIRQLENKTIKKTEKEETNNLENKEKKKKSNNSLKIILILFLVVLMGGGYYYFTTIIKKETVLKKISCAKEYNSNEVNATVNIDNTYNFKENDNLEKIDSIITYKFNTKDDYEKFINDGSIYTYMPESTKKHIPNINNLTIQYITEVFVDSSYNGPVEYEEVITQNKTNEYNCSEKVEK